MATLNNVQLIGHLGKDPEARYTPTGKMVCVFSLAVNDIWGSGEQRQEHTNWLQIEAWNGLAETCTKNLRKGRQIFVEGRIRVENYEDQNGDRRYSFRIVATNIQFLDNKRPEEEALLNTPDEEVPF